MIETVKHLKILTEHLANGGNFTQIFRFMKNWILSIALLLISPFIFSQGILGKLNKAVKADSVVRKITGGTGSQLSQDEVVSGLKEALSRGTGKATDILGKSDGFFTHAVVKILMPDEAKKAEKTLRQLGMSSLVDKAILSMNRAAESAVSGSGDIFLGAIKGMTIQDGLSILRGGDLAATDYLKKSTTPELTAKMRPVIDSCLQKVDATKYWKDVFTQYNKFASPKINPDLGSYVTEKAIAGIFYEIGEEEKKIRKDPAARVSDILKKVFAN